MSFFVFCLFFSDFYFIFLLIFPRVCSQNSDTLLCSNSFLALRQSIYCRLLLPPSAGIKSKCVPFMAFGKTIFKISDYVNELLCIMRMVK